MSDSQLRELWHLRFSKILDLEIEARNYYGNLIKKHQVILGNSKAKEVIEKIIQDEIKHERLVRELIHILDKKTILDKTK